VVVVVVLVVIVVVIVVLGVLLYFNSLLPICISTGCVCTAHIHKIRNIYNFRFNILYIICRQVHNLPPNQNSHASYHSSILIVTVNLTNICKSAILLFHILKQYIINNYYIRPRSSNTQNIYSEHRVSQLKISHVLLFVITECLELKVKAS